MYLDLILANPAAPKQKKYLRQHSVLDWSPTSILSGPCDACLRGSDETRKVHRGMAADEIQGCDHRYIPLFQTTSQLLAHIAYCHDLPTSL
jgi:hypothetical protein